MALSLTEEKKSSDKHCKMLFSKSLQRKKGRPQITNNSKKGTRLLNISKIILSQVSILQLFILLQMSLVNLGRLSCIRLKERDGIDSTTFTFYFCRTPIGPTM